MQNVNKPVSVEMVAEALIFHHPTGYMFVTHAGDLIGPSPSRDEMVTKAALYISSWRKENGIEEPV